MQNLSQHPMQCHCSEVSKEVFRTARTAGSVHRLGQERRCRLSASSSVRRCAVSRYDHEQRERRRVRSRTNVIGPVGQRAGPPCR